MTNYHVLASVLESANVPGRKAVAKVTLLGADGYSQVSGAAPLRSWCPHAVAIRLCVWVVREAAADRGVRGELILNR